MTDVRYTKDHEYIRITGDIGEIGISDYAQKQLGDVVFVELPQIGASFGKGDQAAVVASHEQHTAGGSQRAAAATIVELLLPHDAVGLEINR